MKEENMIPWVILYGGTSHREQSTHSLKQQTWQARL